MAHSFSLSEKDARSELTFLCSRTMYTNELAAAESEGGKISFSIRPSGGEKANFQWRYLYHVIMLLRLESLYCVAENSFERWKEGEKATFKQPENEQFPGHFPIKKRENKFVPHTIIMSIITKLERNMEEWGKKATELITPCPNMNNLSRSIDNRCCFSWNQLKINNPTAAARKQINQIVNVYDLWFPLSFLVLIMIFPTFFFSFWLKRKQKKKKLKTDFFHLLKNSGKLVN